MLHYENVALHALGFSDPVSPSRHLRSGILASFWTYPGSVLPALAVCPSAGARVLVIGQPPPGLLHTPCIPER